MPSATLKSAFLALRSLLLSDSPPHLCYTSISLSLHAHTHTHLSFSLPPFLCCLACSCVCMCPRVWCLHLASNGLLILDWAQVVGLSEALEVVTKRAHDGETKQRIIQDQVEYVTKGVASTRTLGQSTKTSKSTRSGDQINTSRTRSPFPSAQEYEHERAYYPNDLYPSAPRSRQDASPPRERPASAGMRRPASAGRRPASAGRRPSSARERIEDGRDSTRAEAWGSGATGGSGSSMPRLQDRDRERVLELGRMRDEVYYGVGGRRDRSP
jgi:hypothetical protein